MAHRIFNFNAGPSTLPLDVLKIIQEELLDYRGTGMSVMEISHRSPEFDEINESAITLVRELMGLDDKYHVMFCTGGASTQFAMIPFNFAGNGQKGAYVDTGTWSTKAIKEANIMGGAHLAGSSKDNEYRHIPKAADLDVPANSPYLHITTNNTIKGTQWHYTPEYDGIPLIADMSSDILSHQLDYSKFAMVYAGTQKNLGPAGACLVVMHDDLLQKRKDGNPAMWDYRTYATKKSLYNTPPSLTIYIVKLILEWIKNQGGLAAVEKVNKAKYDKVYGMIDQYPDFFKGTVQTDSRSWMNATMRLPNEDLEKKLIADAKAAGFGGLKGHRSVGGIRISMYNAMTLEGVEKVLGFMDEFRKANS
ncbi:MAG: 3-phosphoserine/phosphohydroxythreonine transaminase [candidate division Zixibacteria bacterium]|nr:3-phosphoserine/phosphohydroxythreonine transaminase [candidate division Zixibacteria bacterium]